MRILLVTGWVLCCGLLHAQQQGLINTAGSRYAQRGSVGMGEVQWTSGFWADRFQVCRDSMVPRLWRTYHDAELCHSFKNFEIAAGMDTGSFKGPSFHDGDFYKTLEALAAVYAVTKDPALNKQMDEAIAVIAKAQRPDGYVYTKSIIEQRQSGKRTMFDDKLSFEAYNFGHLMTAACVHYRATGKKTLLEVACKAADFLEGFYTHATPEQARNAICPSHYMGLVELYRTTQNKRYLQLAGRLIDLRGQTEGTDDNSDRTAFRNMQRVAGHAVRANYLLAGAADVYAETGDTGLLHTLDVLWEDIVDRKMYVTGGCGALYDGVSVDGISYNPDTVQKVHQAYGRDYQLPNLTAHNETCANIGNVLWNRRMLLLTGEVKYADVVELALYNSVLSGVSLTGDAFFYTNPLASSVQYPYHMRWEGERQPYIALSNCCPPNIVRTLAEVSDYMYSVTDKGVYVDMYGGSRLSTVLPGGGKLSLEQTTAYPWDGAVTITVAAAPAAAMAVYLRIPGWCKKASLLVNGKPVATPPVSGTYAAVQRIWKAGDQLQLIMDMPATLLASNPLVEETRGQVAVKRGPVVYCLETAGAANGNVFNVVIPAKIQFTPVPVTIQHAPMVALEGQAELLPETTWKGALYQELPAALQPVKVQLVPYYAWANRGRKDMAVWMPVSR